MSRVESKLLQFADRAPAGSARQNELATRPVSNLPASRRKTSGALRVMAISIAIACSSIPCPRSFAAEPPGATASPALTGPIPPTLFSMHIHPRSKEQPWPTVPFGSFRLLAVNTAWAHINPSEGNYDWHILDWILASLKAHGVDDVIYTFASTPSWASSNPNDDCVNARFRGAEGAPKVRMPGACDPPADLNRDGTGTDKHWKDFVRAIVSHTKNGAGAHIQYWEIWNEPNHPFYWAGTFPQMVRMARDATEIIKSIDPQAMIVAPSVGLNLQAIDWLQGYLAAGGGDSADIIGFHGYVHSGHFGDYPSPATLIAGVERYRNTLAKYGQNRKPLWDTEASWGNASVMGFERDEDFQEGFLAAFYLMHWSLGVPRVYWFAWNDFAVGTLWLPNGGGSGTVMKAASAYAEVYKWLVGSTMTRPCTEAEGIWTCDLMRADGKEAQAVWAERGQKNYTPKASLKRVRDLDGNVTSVAGAIKVSSKPLLLEAR
jgi:hypothetical protein